MIKWYNAITQDLARKIRGHQDQRVSSVYRSNEDELRLYEELGEYFI